MDNEKNTLFLDSKNRTSGTIENFSIVLNQPINKIVQVEIISAEIPFTFYIVNATNNTLCWSDNLLNTYSANLSIGNWTVTDFVTMMQSNMNAVMPGFTITYNKQTFKLTIANPTAFTLDMSNISGTTTCANLIGMTGSTAFSTNLTLPNMINLGGPKYLLIKSLALTDPKVTKPFHNVANSSILYKVPIRGMPGDIITEKNMYVNLLTYGIRQTFQTLDFQLTDDQDQIVDLNGLDWSITLSLVTG